MGVGKFPNSLSLILFLLFPSLLLAASSSPDTIVVEENSGNFHRLLLPKANGPESIAFDPHGRGPYTGVSDGRVLRWDARLHRWAKFAVSPHRRGVTAAMCRSNEPEMEPKCGRPLGLEFDQNSGYLYIADAYHGLLVVKPGGGLATPVATAAEGVPFNFTNGVDIDQTTGMVYFTDSSSKYSRREWIWAVLIRDASGRFMSYNPRTKEVKVLLRGLEFPNGVAVSGDKSYVLVAESTKKRVLRYWIKGPKAGTWDVFANLGDYGYPDNVRITGKGDFWVAANSGQGKLLSTQEEEEDNGVGAILLNADGKVVAVVNDRRDGSGLSEVRDWKGTLYLGSVAFPYVDTYKVWHLS